MKNNATADHKFNMAAVANENKFRSVAKAVEAINVKRQTPDLNLPFPVCR